MPVSLLKTCCQMCILHHIIGDGHGNIAYKNVQQFLLHQLEEGAWGVESLAILERAVKQHGYFLTPSVILALLPNITKVLGLRECPALDEECLDIAYKRCNYLHALDITENPLLSLSKVDLFGTCSAQLHTILTSATLEDCSQVNDTHIQTLLINAPNLQNLNIARCGITDQVFLLDEDKQLAKEACVKVDKRFMKGSHLNYDCRLQHVDVSRCSDFTSTGVRHLCTLCGPTLRSVNLAWTKVECTAFLYLSGMGFPSVVKFFMSSGAMANATMKPLLYQLQTFDAICSDIVRKFNGEDVRSENRMDGCADHFNCDEPETHSPAATNITPDAMSTPCLSSDVGMTTKINSISACATNSDLENDLASMSATRSASKFEIVCMDGVSHIEVKVKDHSTEVYKTQQGVNLSPSSTSMKTDGDCCNCVRLSNSNGNTHGSESRDSTDPEEWQLESNCKTNDCVCLCHILLSEKQESNEQNAASQPGTVSQSGDQMKDDREQELSRVHWNGKTLPLDTNQGGRTLNSSILELTDKKLVPINDSSEQKTIFTPNITSIIIDATVFHDEILGLKCFQKFLITNKNLLSLSILSGINGNYLDDCVLDLVGSYARRLESLSVQGSDKLTDDGFTAIANNCHSLSLLDLTGVSFVGDKGITPLVDSLPLTRLKLAETRITGRFMNHLASLPMTQELKEIDLSWCEEMEVNSALNNFISSSPHLEKLMLRECCISATTLTCISQHSHFITELSLASNMSVMRDEGVVPLTANLPALTNIDLGWNSYLTNLSIHALLSNCPRLEKANLEGLKLITSLPFMPLISVPEELCVYLEGRRESVDQNSGKEEEILKLSELPCLPQRSSLYSTNLQFVNLNYSDFVEDTQLTQIVTITNGGVQILDYYGNRVEPSKPSLESFLAEYMDGRGERG